MTRARPLLAALAALLLGTAESGAQGSCNVNRNAACVVGGTATYAMTVAIPSVVRLTAPGATIALGVATPEDFTAGFGAAVSAALTVRANTGWTVTLSTAASTWTGTGPAARLDKPASDLQWSTAIAGPYADLSTLPIGVQTGTATAGSPVPLFLRIRYAWTLDTPGAYSLPLVLTITAP